MSKCDLSVRVAPGLKLINPVIAASGTFGYGDECSELVSVEKLGAIVCKGTTLKPRDGNCQPRIVEVTGGVLNSIGLQNIGVEAVIKEKAPIWAGWSIPVIVNIAGETVEEYGALAAMLDGVAGVAAIEVNISCPNVKQGGMQFGTDPRMAADVTRSVRRSTSLPVIVKLSPNVTDITAVAIAVEEAGAHAVSLINTVSGMAIDIKTRAAKLGNIHGGLSGPAIKPVALHMVYRVCGCVKVPVIGCGGICTWQDALEFIMAGATAVEVGTANLVDPAAGIAILEGLQVYLDDHGVKSICDERGSARN
jgi:dihydroorotate dehydrogenase (NAD+) catalytic subunit